MTWNPLKQTLAKNYLTKKPSPAQPLLSISEDRELLIAVQRLMVVEDTIRKLVKEMKMYNETIMKLDLSEQKLTMNLSSCDLVHISDKFRQIVEEYYSATTQIGKNIHDMVELYQKTFIEPLKKLRHQFALIETALLKRETLVENWKCSYNTLKKLQDKKDKTASHAAKIARERKNEEILGKKLKNVHMQLLSELPEFLDKRLEYIKPTVHALIMIQLEYYATNAQLFSHFVQTQDHSSKSNFSEEQCQLEFNTQMSRIRNLTIVKDH